MAGSRHTVDWWKSSQSLPKTGRRHQVDGRSSHSRPKRVVITKSTRDRHAVDRKGCRHQVDKRSSHSRPKGLPSPSQQKVVTQSTNVVAVTKSARRGCRHQVDKRSSHSRPKERGHQVNPGAGTPSQPRSGDTKSTHGKRGGDTKSTHGKWGGDTKSTHGERGDTKSTHGTRVGTQTQPTEMSQGVSTDRRGRLGGKRRAHKLLKAKEKG